MDVKVSQDGARLVAVVTGEVDADNCDLLGAEIEPALNDDITVLVIEASRLSFIDSSGITELLRIRDVMQERGGECRLETPTEQVRRILEITGLADAFAVN